jgi:crossover junction endodeoxyribonuclease RusA
VSAPRSRPAATVSVEPTLSGIPGRADRESGQLSPHTGKVENVWRLDLPFTAPPLRDNDRMHWSKEARIKSQLRESVAWLARAERLPTGLDRVRIGLCWQPGVNRRRDPLSIAPTLKPLVDGLVDYRLVDDDDTSHVELYCDVYDAKKGVPAAVWLSIRAVPR